MLLAHVCELTTLVYEVLEYPHAEERKYSPDEMAVADSTLAMPLQGMRRRSREGVSVLPVAKTKRRVSCADPSREDAEENKTERKVI